MEIYWRDSFICPAEEEYKQMTIRSKFFIFASKNFQCKNNPLFIFCIETGGLFGLAIRLMQLFSTNKVNLGPLMAILGLYFQVRDDYANLNLKEVCHSCILVISLF